MYKKISKMCVQGRTHIISFTMPTVSSPCGLLAKLFVLQYLSLAAGFLLADRTNVRAYATVLRSSSLGSVTLPKRCVLKQKLLLAAYRKSYMQKSIGTKK